MPECFPPYPPQSGGGARGVSGIQCDEHIVLVGYWIPAYAVSTPFGVAARKSEIRGND